MKGISGIIATILLVLIAIALVGVAYVFFSGMIGGRTAKPISIADSDGNTVVVSNDGTEAINSGEIKIFVNGKEATVLNPQAIQPHQSAVLKFAPPEGGSVTVNVVSPSNAVSYKAELNEYVDNDGDGANEAYLGSQLVELNIANQNSVYTYNGHASHYLGWPLYVDQEIWYVDAVTGVQVQQLTSPNSAGNVDYQIIRCQNDGSFTGCTPITIGNRGTCTDGVVKEYGDLEPDASTTFYDNNYRDCDTGNPYLLYTTKSYDHASGTKTRIWFYQNAMSGYGKYKLCVKYIHSSGLYTAPKCMDFISEWLDMDLASGTGGNKNYGTAFSWLVNNVKTRYDSQPVLSGYAEKRCSIYSWNWQHNPSTDNSPSATFVRHRTWDNYWAYLGVMFGISSSQPAGDRAVTATIKLPDTCFLRDRGGNNNYAWYHHNCGWYHDVNGVDKTAYCCPSGWSTSDTGNCDKFQVVGQYGGTVTITDHFDASGDNYDDTRIYIECPNGEAATFGNTAKKYTVTVAGATKFWVNDMDYSLEKTFSEAFPDSRYVANINDFSCSNLKLNFCGRAYTYTELFDWSEIYGSKYTNPNYVCVSGPQCPHTTC